MPLMPKITWDDVCKKPVLMFHTLRGPMMGHFDRAANTANSKSDAVRIYAPAMVQFMPPSNVVYLPVAFVEHHIDVYLSTVMGTSPVPEAVLQGYSGYFQTFIQGGYAMQPMVMRAGIEGEEHKIELSPATVKNVETTGADESAVVTCPGCQATVADWTDHYPVILDDGSWACELRFPGLREKYPDYDPPHPTSVGAPS